MTKHLIEGWLPIANLEAAFSFSGLSDGAAELALFWSAE